MARNIKDTLDTIEVVAKPTQTNKRHNYYYVNKKNAQR